MQIPGGSAFVSPALPSDRESLDSPEKLRNAARQFESVLIAQLLKSSHADGSSWMGTGDESGGATLEFAEECFAKAISEQGGLGLAAVVESGVRRQVTQKATE